MYLILQHGYMFMLRYVVYVHKGLAVIWTDTSRHKWTLFHLLCKRSSSGCVCGLTRWVRDTLVSFHGRRSTTVVETHIVTQHWWTASQTQYTSGTLGTKCIETLFICACTHFYQQSKEKSNLLCDLTNDRLFVKSQKAEEHSDRISEQSKWRHVVFFLPFIYSRRGDTYTCSPKG